MKYILNKCLVEDMNGDLVWKNTKPDGEFIKMQSILDYETEHKKSVFNHFKLNCKDTFKVVIYLKDESKANLAKFKICSAISSLFNLFDDGYCSLEDSVHKNGYSIG